MNARRELDDFAQQDSPLRNVAHWGIKPFSTKAPENGDISAKQFEISEEVGKSPWDTLVDIAIADELETSFGNPVDDDQTLIGKQEWGLAGL